MPGAINNHLQITLFFVLSEWLIAVKCRGAASLQQDPRVSSSLAWLPEWDPGCLSSCDNLAWKRSSTPVCTSYWAEGLCPLGNSFPNSWCPGLKTALQSLGDSLLCRNWPGLWECRCKLRDARSVFPHIFSSYDSIVWLSEAGTSRRSRTFWPQVTQSAWVGFGPF